MISLVGYTGFVGSNLKNSFEFDGLYNSKNIHQAFGTNPDILYYSGVSAQKYIANQFPEKDMQIIENAYENIKKINPKKLVLISTVDVYKNPVGKDENSPMETENLHPYGLNRLALENMVKDSFDCHIIRLPGLYGENIKKNFIYDLIKFIPAMLKEDKFNQLSKTAPELKNYYTLQDNGFYKLNENINEENCRKIFENLGFSALNFTDSRGVFQFYNLKYLFKDIQTVIENNIPVMNIATEGVSVKDIYKAVRGEDFDNILGENYPYYDFKTCYYKLFGGKDGYIQQKEFILNDIKNFVLNQQRCK